MSSIIIPASANPSHAAIMDLVKGSFLTEPVEGITETHFLDKEHVLQTVAVYLPDGAVNQNQLAEWMVKDGSWGGTKRKRIQHGRVSGRMYHLVQEAYRDYSWADLLNVHQFRRHVRLTNGTIFNIGYIRRSSTRDTSCAILKSMELQAIKLTRKLLCEKVYGSLFQNNIYLGY
ncbi:hypothetical protein BDB00DRAFT_21555 [Zychaea mexicana]|uniref:uncharacterized protein n=1 Tax=Zychaea mexicana TaxID=64656 RepID=UPI0022FEA634|nr:uncharacterized protein BDB00DRAFT_21555 [Zychaea mexicana]KAI9497253.1 hypothetical protein BDB00DRAFT_21555 [Zychaea mexicana]